MPHFRVTWWIHGAGSLHRGTDIVEAIELSEKEAEELIEADLSEVRGKDTGLYGFPNSSYKPKLPNFCKKHEDLSLEAKHSEISNWGVLKVRKETMRQ